MRQITRGVSCELQRPRAVLCDKKGTVHMFRRKAGTDAIEDALIEGQWGWGVPMIYLLSGLQRLVAATSVFVREIMDDQFLKADHG
jgi:hypothetical protein